MVNENQKKGQRDEIVFSAGYSLGKAYFSLAIMAVAFSILGGMGYIACSEIIVGTSRESKEYLLAFLLSFASIAYIGVMIDSIFFKEIRFYRDRVTKVWHLFGSRTIYYSRAKVVGPPKEVYLGWLHSGYQIREIGEDGKILLKQIPIMYMEFFFPSKAAKKIRMILDYLTDDKTGNPRIFKKYMLNKEDLCQQSQQ